jgi:hypothetical protein
MVNSTLTNRPDHAEKKRRDWNVMGDSIPFLDVARVDSREQLAGCRCRFKRAPSQQVTRLAVTRADRSRRPARLHRLYRGRLGTFRTSIAFAGWVSRGGLSTGVINMAGRYQGFHSLNTGNIEIFWRADGWCWWSRAPGCPSESAPVGPFLTSTDAYLNANGGACLIPRPARVDRVA